MVIFYTIAISLFMLQSTVSYVISQNVDDIVGLKHHLFKNSTYDKSIRPVLDQSHKTEVKMKLSLSSITSVDIENGQIWFTGHLVVMWRDELHTWEETEFGGINRLGVKEDQIWTPRLKNIVQGGGAFVVASAWLNSNGTVYMIFGGSFTAHCGLNSYYYPFDEQNCTSKVIAVENDSSELNLTILPGGPDISDLSKHGQWDVINAKSDILHFKEKDIDIELLAHSMTILLKRRPEVIMLHTTVPIVLTALLNVMIYFVPVKSGERISFAVTILMTFVFFTRNITDDLPKTALIVPFVSVLMALMNCLCTFNVLISVLFSRLANDSVLPIPACLKRLVRKVHLMKRSGGFCVKHVKPKECNPSKIAPETTVTDLTETYEKMDTLSIGHENSRSEAVSAEPNKETKECEITWAMVTDVCDMILFYILFFVLSVTAIFISLIFGLKST